MQPNLFMLRPNNSYYVLYYTSCRYYNTVNHNKMRLLRSTKISETATEKIIYFRVASLLPLEFLTKPLIQTIVTCLLKNKKRVRGGKSGIIKLS